MRSVTRLVAALVLAATISGSAQNSKQQASRLIAYVMAALRNGDLTSASALVAQYRKLNGDTPEALEALSWVARGELASGNSTQASNHAEEIKRSAQGALATRSLDAEPHLPIALGAAYEIEAETLLQQHKRTEAIQMLQSAFRTWRGTSIADRLQKNLNLITLQGRPAPLIEEPEWIGVKPATLASLRGKPVLLFFWAHWCADCKADAPVIGQLAAEYASKGLVVLMPTRRYGYTADDDQAAPAKEMSFIQKVYDRFYSGIRNVGVPVSTANFERFGASTTPTIVLLDRRSIVKLYHPGAMDESALRAAIEPVLR